MPSVDITIQETIESVSRPIIYDILETVKKYTLINGDVRTIFTGDIQKWTQTAGDLGNKTKESQFSSQRYVQIEVDQSPSDSNLGSTAVYYADNPPIIADKDIRLWVTPVYSHTDVTISFKFFSYNKDEAFRWYYNNRTAISKMRDVIIHTVNYHYPIPDPVIDLIETIYTLKETIDGDGMSYADYVQNHFSNKTTIVSSLDGKTKQLAIAETQTRLLGQFTFEPLPEKPERVDSNEMWVCSFSYKFTYDLPMSLNVRYPLMVHNQILPSPYSDITLDPYNLDSKELEFPISLGSLYIFEVEYMNQGINPVFRIPKIDDFVPKSAIPMTKGIFYALIALDPNNITELLNLNDLDYLQLDSDILEFIKQGEYQYITQPYQSIFNISLYNYDTLVDSKLIACDENLNITSTADLSLKSTYRMRFSIYKDLSMLNTAALYRLYNFIANPPVSLNLPQVPTPLSINSLESIVGNLNISSAIEKFGSPVPTTDVNGQIQYSYINNNNEAASAINPSTYIYENVDNPIPLNLNIIENYVRNALKTTVPGPIPLNVAQTNIPYSPQATILTNYQKYLLVNNPFYNSSNVSPVVNMGGSSVFNKVIELLNIKAIDVNKIYRVKMGKNLINNSATTNNNMNNPRMFGDKTYQLMSVPLITQQGNAEDYGFKSVMTAGIIAISNGGR